jgi:hypothetical protein
MDAFEQLNCATAMTPKRRLPMWSSALWTWLFGIASRFLAQGVGYAWRPMIVVLSAARFLSEDAQAGILGKGEGRSHATFVTPPQSQSPRQCS